MTVDGLVYSGMCLKCNTLVAASKATNEEGEINKDRHLVAGEQFSQHYKRYRPSRLPSYSIGDNCRKEDMAKATTEAISELCVNDCAWIRRSDGPGKKGGWSYAIVRSRTHGDDASITFQVNTLGFTKTIGRAQWACHVRLPAITLPGYSVGDTGRIEDMDIADEKETAFSVSTLQSNDAAFVARSNGLWVYALLMDRTDGSGAQAKFKISQEGSTKIIKMSECGKYVRCIKRMHCDQFDEVAKPFPRFGSNHNPSRQSSKEAATDNDFVQKVPHQTSNSRTCRGTEQSSSLEEQLQLIYKKLDQRYHNESIGSETFQSVYVRSCELYRSSLNCQRVIHDDLPRDELGDLSPASY